MAVDTNAFCQSCHTSFGEDPQVQAMHETILPDLEEGQSCRTCHADQPPASADAQCTTCHNLLEGGLTLASGEQIPLQVHAEEIAGSVHGNREIQGVAYSSLQCIDCHDPTQYQYPHAPVAAADARAYTLAREESCQNCHQGIFELNHNSVHAIAIANGNRDAASCVDCHGAHNIQPPDEPRERISSTCAQCHSTIHEQYATSVHGAALLGEQNPDVPVCTDCHGAHEITDPTTAQFRLQSPQLCAECHADEALMAHYGISTDVFDTYVADFHGTTVTLFEKQTPDQESNSAVCYDCHGVHDILPATDQNSQVLKENLLETCRQCHPDASANFPDAWMSHFEPSLDHYPLVFGVDLFYRFLIPAMVGGFVLFIGADVARRAWDRRRNKESSAE
jgi:predicted CXXCH cytochrome family protein